MMNETGQRYPEKHQTMKGNQWCVSRLQAADLWCCTEDGSRPPECGLKEQDLKPPLLLRSKSAVVIDREKVIPLGVACMYLDYERKQISDDAQLCLKHCRK
jgi:hypothetical protein